MPKSWRSVWPFLLPFTSIFAVFLLFPAIYSIYLSFKHADIYADLTNIWTSMRWVGLENYQKLLYDQSFYWSLLMTLYYAVLVIPMGIFLSLSLAAILSNNLPGAKFFRAAYFLPHVLDLFVIAVVWTSIYAPNYGVLDQILGFFQMDKTSPIRESGVLAHPWWAMAGIALAVVLKGSGFGMILYLAAIQNIPADVYEAAEIDGANGWQKFTRITMPLVKPVTLLLVVTGILGSLMAFSEVYAMTQGKPNETLPQTAMLFGQQMRIPFLGGASVGTTKVSGYYLFDKFYVAQDYGYASAISVALLFISLPLSVIAFFVFRTDGPGFRQVIAKFIDERKKKSAAQGAVS